MDTQILDQQQLEILLSAQAELADRAGPEADSPFLRLLASLERRRLSRLVTKRRYAPGEVVMREGQTGDALYMIWSGRVVVFIGEPEAPTILGYRGAGEIIGEMALLEKRPRSASVVALSDLRLLKISQESFYNLLESDPAIGLNIMEVLSSRLRVSDHVRSKVEVSERHLINRLSELQVEKQHLLEIQRLRQETTDLIVHDLRTPLGAVSLAINMLTVVLPDEIVQENQQLLGIAQSGCERMLRLVDSLLEVSRMEAGDVKLDFSEVNVCDLIDNVLQGFLVPPDRRIDFQTDLPAGQMMITLDREKIERVLTNLLDNALKYTPDGGKITVKAQAQEENALISISDTGLGIPPEERERIFERFAQVTNGARRARRGFGLGLAYCRVAVEAHGGRIWIEDGEAGIGSCFAFTLPTKPSL